MERILRLARLDFALAVALRTSCFVLLIACAAIATSWLGPTGRVFAIALAVSVIPGSILIVLHSRRNWLCQGGAAASVEARLPELRNDLSTWKEWGGGSGPYSSSLLSALADALPNRIEAVAWERQFGIVALSRKHGIGALRVTILAGLTALLGFFPPPLSHDMAGKETDGVGGARSEVRGLTAHSLTVSYRYPEYSGRAERDFKPLGGSSIRALRGTDVTLTFELDSPSYREPGIRSPGGEEIPATSDANGRHKVRFTLRDPGELRIRGVDRGYVVDVESDSPPAVNIEEPPSESEVDPKSNVLIRYSAEDDFGLTTLKAVVEGENYRREILLPKPEGRKEIGSFQLIIPQLLLPRGTRSIAAKVVASDNDGVSGSKEGESKVVVLRFPDLDAIRDREVSRIQEWQEIALSVLADDLEDETWQKQWIAGGESLARLRKVAESVPDAKRVREILGRLIELRAESTLLPAAQRASEISLLETLVLFLDQEVGREEGEAVARKAEDLEGAAADLLDRLAGNEAKDAPELLRALDELRKAMKELQAALQRVRQDAPPEFLNPEALSERSMKSLSEELAEVEKLLAEGKLEEAKKRLQAQAKKVKEIAREMGASGRGLSRGFDQKLAKKFEKMRNELSEIRDRQRDLADRTSRLIDEDVPDDTEMPPSAELLKKIRQLRASLEKADRESRIDSTEPWHSTTRRKIPPTAEDGKRLYEASRTGKFRSAKELSQRIERTLREVTEEGRRLRGVIERSMPFGMLGGGPGGLASSEEAFELAREIKNLFDEEANRRMAEGPSERSKKKSRELSSEQKKLLDRMNALEKQLAEVEKKLGPLGKRVKKPMAGAKEKMSSASGDLENGAMTPALSNERDALAFLDEIEQAVREEESGGSEGGGSPMADAGSGLPHQASREPVLLPAPKSKKETEIWRKRIMDALRAKPPSGQEEVTKDYFLELAE